jgi:D-alanyl-D-alanine dipeptidase
MAWFTRRRDILRALTGINDKLEIIMSQQSTEQADIDAATAAITNLTGIVTTVAADLETAQANILAEITALKQANPAVDTTKLDAAVAGIATPLAALQTADTAVDALETPAPAPAPAGS